MPHARLQAAVRSDPAAATPSNPQLRAISLKQVMELTSLSKAHIYALIARREFPAPGKVGKRSIWPSNEIDDWLTARFAERPAAQTPSPTTELAPLVGRRTRRGS
jgi:prophage regulatory protein